MSTNLLMQHGFSSKDGLEAKQYYNECKNLEPIGLSHVTKIQSGNTFNTCFQFVKLELRKIAEEQNCLISHCKQEYQRSAIDKYWICNGKYLFIYNN